MSFPETVSFLETVSFRYGRRMRSTAGTRTVARLWMFAIVVVFGVVPVVLHRDSYPLSTFPMFSSNRSTREPVDTAVLVDSDGVVHHLSPQVIAGTDEPIIATVVVAKSVSDGTAMDLCHEITARLDPHHVGHVEIVTVVYDALDWFEGRREPIERRVHASCPTETR